MDYFTPKKRENKTKHTNRNKHAKTGFAITDKIEPDIVLGKISSLDEIINWLNFHGHKSIHYNLTTFRRVHSCWGWKEKKGKWGRKS